MQEKKRLCLQFASYAGALVISLVLQTSHPEMFALLCTPLPLGEYLNPTEGMDVPLNQPVLPPTGRVK